MTTNPQERAVAATAPRTTGATTAKSTSEPPTTVATAPGRSRAKPTVLRHHWARKALVADAMAIPSRTGMAPRPVPNRPRSDAVDTSRNADPKAR